MEKKNERPRAARAMDDGMPAARLRRVRGNGQGGHHRVRVMFTSPEPWLQVVSVDT